MIAIALSVSVAALAQAQPAPDVTGWSADVAALRRAIEEIHPDPYRVNGPDVFDRFAAELEADLEALAPHEAILGMHRLMGLAADGHTEAVDRPHASLRGPWLPLIIRRFRDGWFVRTGHRRCAALFGKRIVRIGELPIEEVVARVRPFVSADNAFGALDPIGNALRDPAVLHAAGITAERLDRIEIVLAGPDDEETVAVVEAGGDSWVTAEWADADALLGGAEEPLYRRLDGNYAFEHLEERDVVYVLFDSVRDDEGETIEEFFGRVFEFVAENEVDRFVLDLRENSGGNLELNLPILHGLIASRVNRPGHLFVIIGRDTYSAAMNLAVLLERHTHALFVGEPTGATPNHFGDTRIVGLEASGLVVEISELYWQNSDPRDGRPWIEPDLPAPIAFADFVAGRDPALAAILDFEPPPDLAGSFGRTVDRWKRAQRGRQAWNDLLGGVR